MVIVQSNTGNPSIILGRKLGIILVQYHAATFGHGVVKVELFG